MKVEIKYIPTPKQIPFHNSKAKFRALITGVAFGKSAAGAVESLRMCLLYPGNTHLILAPTSKIMDNATLNQFFKFCPKELIKVHLKSKSTIYFQNGSKLVYLTADNERHVDRLRGMEVGSFWCDESRLFPSYVWEVVLTRLRDAKGPLKGFVTTTPNGFDWLYYYFIKKMNPRNRELLDNPDDYEWFGGTMMDNIYTPQSFKDNLISQLRGKFGRQEVYGEITSFEGMCYSCFQMDKHVIEVGDRQYKSVIAGIDWGFVHNMAGIIIGLDYDNKVFIIEEYCRSKVDVEDLGNWMLEKVRQYNIEQVYADPAQPMFIVKLSNMGIPIQAANNEVLPGINFIFSLMEIKDECRFFIDKSCEHLIDEINQYRYAEKRDGKAQKDEPIKVNDDCCDAMRYCLFSHLGSQGSFLVLDAGKFF